MFDKARCIGNIYALAKKKGLKIGELEEKAGVSKGYLSRINKEDNTSIPPINLLDSIAEQLNVSVDYLINFSPEGMTENDEFLMQFVDKLLKRTNARQLEWILQTENFLPPENKLSKEKAILKISSDLSDYYRLFGKGDELNSHFYSGVTSLAGDGYYCELFPNSSTRLYIVDVIYKDFDETKSDILASAYALELYILDEGKINPLCSTVYVKPEIEEHVKKLYKAVATVSSRIGITQETRSIMKKFIDK